MDDVKSRYGHLRDELTSFVEVEQRKYPLTDREKMLVSILDRTLEALDYQALTGVLI